MTAPDLSIIIPAYKEGDDFGPRLETLARWLKSHDYGKVEVLVVSDGDESSGKLAESKKKLFDSLRAVYPGRRMGKGGGVRMGMFEAKGRYRLFMDADLATPLTHLDDVKRLMDGGGKVGIAVRDLFRIHDSFIRAVVSKVANLVVQAVLLPGIKDSQCGFKVFEAEAAEEIFSRQTLTSWSFDVEILAIAKFLGYKIVTFEAPDWKDPKGEKEGLVGESPLKVAIKQARDPLKVRWNLFLGRYDKKSFKYEPAKGS